MRGRVLPFGPPKASREMSYRSVPRMIYGKLTRVPPGQALRIGRFSVPRKLEEGGRDPRIFQGRERILKTYQGVGR